MPDKYKWHDDKAGKMGSGSRDLNKDTERPISQPLGEDVVDKSADEVKDRDREIKE